MNVIRFQPNGTWWQPSVDGLEQTGWKDQFGLGEEKQQQQQQKKNSEARTRPYKMYACSTKFAIIEFSVHISNNVILIAQPFYHPNQHG